MMPCVAKVLPNPPFHHFNGQPMEIVSTVTLVDDQLELFLGESILFQEEIQPLSLVLAKEVMGGNTQPKIVNSILI